ncbi:Dehydrogenase (flavoprotein)-like protein [Methanocaldococcus fervens AG86]|uniref:Dehydrogenase (Flavoprotein)-like protein n=2 Tax=Methanocaldococcus TaxID=196118 RepID=C7P686_METFA|nr:Dehydrogenase (flavoprotein)-like protein [Methanocaldococcus fervens AG86]
MGVIMQVSIIGAGLAGSIVYRLLSKQDYHIDIYDHLLVRGCKSMNFIFSNKNELLITKKILKTVNLDINDYIINEVKDINVGGDDYYPNKKFYVINKSKLIEDLVPRTMITNREFNPIIKRYMTKVSSNGTLAREFVEETETKFYDLIIDASGNAKVLQLEDVNAKYKNDIRTCQFLIYYNNSSEDFNKLFIDEIKIHKGKPMIGHTWIVPVGDGLYHVGCAYYKNDHELWEFLNKYVKKMFGNDYTKVCECYSRINGNLISESFIGRMHGKRGIAGVGESIGLTTPLGHGNIYAIHSAYVLSKLIIHYELNKAILKYKKYVVKKFRKLDEDKKSVKSFNLLRIKKLLKEYYNIPTYESIKIMVKSLC